MLFFSKFFDDLFFSGDLTPSLHFAEGDLVFFMRFFFVIVARIFI